MSSRIPLSQRFVLLVSPGFMFGSAGEMAWPEESWNDVEELAAELQDQKSDVIGFRRFEYSPLHGRRFKDKGWIYFRGVKVAKEDVLSGKAKTDHPNIPLNDTAVSNVRINGWDCLYLEEYKKLWPLDKEDRVVMPKVCKVVTDAEKQTLDNARKILESLALKYAERYCAGDDCEKMFRELADLRIGVYVDDFEKTLRLALESRMRSCPSEQETT